MSAKPLTQKEWHEYLAKTWGEAVNAAYKDEIEAAVLAEREACAKLCEEQYEYYGHDHVFAAKIRARQ